MNIKQINFSDNAGGAGRAAYRIHQALRQSGIDSQLLVSQARLGDWTVQGPGSKWVKVWVELKLQLAKLVVRLLRTDNSNLHSPAVSPTGWARRLNGSDADIVHLHWLGGEMISIPDIGRIKKPLVWTLHDMWAFCGAEHYAKDERWKLGYRRNNRPVHEAGLDLNRWIWSRKRRHWKQPIHIIAPSHWLADCVRQSALMRDWPVTVIPNAIDTDRWQPVDKGLARSLLGLPPDVPLLLFGEMRGGQDPRKGFDLLSEALQYLRKEPDAERLELVVFGQLAPQKPADLGFPLHYTGHLSDDMALRVLYSAVDLMALPSRQDNLPNTGVEALACGTPVVAFNTCGLPDIVEHKKTGYLATAFDAEDFASGVLWVLANKESYRLGENARNKAAQSWNYNVVAEQYKKVYQLASGS